MESITYLWHDGFLFQNNRMACVFDYWTLPEGYDGPNLPFLNIMNSDKPLYVLVSHHHKDHFNPIIFEWEKIFPKIKFILSKDTFKHVAHKFKENSLYKGYKPNPDNIIVLKKGEQFEDAVLKVKAFGSTDIGNSYLVEADGKKIFHAGDLNAWIWKDESTPNEIRASLKAFTDILDDIFDYAPEIDYAMFPVDSRIGTDFFTGAYLFVRKIKVGKFFPMHFELGETELQKIKYHLDACDFRNYMNPERGEYICLANPMASYVSNSDNPGNTLS